MLGERDMKAQTVKMMLWGRNPGEWLKKRSNLKKSTPRWLAGRPVVYTYPGGVRVGTTEWL